MTPGNRSEIERYADIQLKFEAELGRCRMTLRELVNLETGKILRLSRPVGEDLPVYVGGALIGRGEVIRLHHTMAVRIAAFASAR